MPYIDFVVLIVDKLVAARSSSQAKNGVCDFCRIIYRSHFLVFLILPFVRLNTVS